MRFWKIHGAAQRWGVFYRTYEITAWEFYMVWGLNRWIRNPIPNKALLLKLASSRTWHMPDRCTMRILIVDDDELSLAILEGVLDEMGYEVERATNGREALTMLHRGDIHIVITDWEMPTMNGLDLCRAIREDDFAGYIYIIMLTGREGGQQKIEGLHAGADAFLVKPLNSEEMVVSLKTAERILGLETRDLTMFALAKLSESRDPETGAHIERVQSYARVIAQQMSTTPANIAG